MTQANSPTAATPSPQHCDVLVIGGGPAGSTAAALLARQGRQVVLLEKAHHPRFHIGESLLPANVALFDALGLREQVQAMGMPKWGVEFVSPHHAHHSFVEFSEALNKQLPMAWQVRRSQLDEMLFNHAAAQGAQALQGCQVRRVDLDDDGATVHAVQADGSARCWRALFVVDASGRDTLLARQLGIKQRNPRHNSSAVFGHFTGATRLAGDKRQGNISIFWFEHGWFWFIPLADGSTSVGATCWPRYLKQRSKPMKDFFFDTIALCPPLAQRLQQATLVDGAVHATGNYTYSATQAAGPRHVLLGDAFAFVDPVFSAGVYLAMDSAFKGVEVVSATLDRPHRAAAARRAYEAHVRHGTKVFSWFIFRMTSPTLRELFMSQRDPAPGKAAVVSVLAGDVFARGRLRLWLAFFKGIYYVGSALQWRRSWQAWRKRRQDIQDCGAVPGETVLVDPR